MKNIFKTLLVLLIVGATGSFFVSCEEEELADKALKLEESGYVVAKLASSLEDWENNNFVTSIDGGAQTFFVDARLADGSNNWNDFDYEYNGVFDGYEISELEESILITVSKSFVTGSPNHLKLVLNAIDDLASVKKAWTVSEIKDAAGNVVFPMTPIPSPYMNLSDDQMIFYKGSKVEYNPGANRTDLENAILTGTESTFFSSYAVTNETVEFLVNHDTYANPVFNFVSVDFNEIVVTISYEYGGTTYEPTVKLVPVN